VRLLAFWKPPRVSVVKVEALVVPIARKRCLSRRERSALGSHSEGWHSPAVMKCLGGGKLFVLPAPGQNISVSTNVTRVDVLRLGSPSLVDPFLEGLSEARELPVCQLIVPFEGTNTGKKGQVVALLKGKGFEILKCHGTYRLPVLPLCGTKTLLSHEEALRSCVQYGESSHQDHLLKPVVQSH